jgi:hypothetical protein
MLGSNRVEVMKELHPVAVATGAQAILSIAVIRSAIRLAVRVRTRDGSGER